MKIVSIFEVVNGALYSVQFDDKEEDEYHSLFGDWNNPFFLREFFKENQQYLTNGFWGTISINDAVKKTLGEVERLESLLMESAELGKGNVQKTLQTIFKPLHNNTINTPPLQPSKLKGSRPKSWLRVYAIRIAPNVFVVTGGGIKLTRTMQESLFLTKELEKMKIAENYLREKGVLDENDLELLELWQ